MITPFDETGAMTANVQYYFHLWDHFARQPVKYVRIKCTEDYRIWLIFANGNTMEYSEGGLSDIPCELMDYDLKGIIIMPDTDCTYYLHATTYEPPAQGATA